MRVLLGVTGGIAAYKAADLVSRLVKLDAEVRVVMTRNATQFVGPLTFEAMSGNPVMVDALETGHGIDGPSSIQHINWAKWAEITVLAPATAASLGKLAHGIADNALTTVWLAVPEGTPGLICPAMNTQMWLHPAVKRNLAFLAECGRYDIVAPSEKRLACGDEGVGGLAEVDTIVAAIVDTLDTTKPPK